MKAIAILTDFGLEDTYVGVMKGVIQGIVPGASIIDLSHAVEPQNLQQAAFMLLNSYSYFPAGTVFLVVVDPGVGTSRMPVVVQAGGYTFVAPDNGVLSYVLSQVDTYQVFALENESYQLANASQTFHGRDIFAPAAAYIANGVSPDRFGTEIDNLVELPSSSMEMVDNEIVGEVIHIDHFGNLITNIGKFQSENSNHLKLNPLIVNAGSNYRFARLNAKVIIGDMQIEGISSTYGQVAVGETLALIGSSGFLEVSVNQGNAAEKISIKKNTQVRLKMGD